MNNLFFVLGNPRSGTTLLRLMLNNHRSITIPPECGFMLWLAGRYSSMDFSKEENITRFLEDVGQTKKIETWNLDMPGLQDYVMRGKPSSYQELCLMVYRYYAASMQKQPLLIGDKNNFYLNYIPQIRKLFPAAKFVLIVRDGRDVACSYKDLAIRKIESIYAPKLPFEIEKIAAEWKMNNSLLIQEMCEGAALVKYEDLIVDPQTELARLCAFLNLPFDPQMFDYYNRNSTEKQEPTEFLQWKEKTLQPPDASNAGKYLQLLTRQEINEFNRIAGEELKFFGYDVEIEA